MSVSVPMIRATLPSGIHSIGLPRLRIQIQCPSRWRSRYSNEFCCELAGVLPMRLVQDALAIVGMNPRQPRLARSVDLLVQAEAAHLPPHARIEDLAVPEVVVPDALPRALQREVPAALALGERGLGELLLVDVLDLEDQVDRLAGALVAQHRRRHLAPEACCRPSGGSAVRRGSFRSRRASACRAARRPRLTRPATTRSAGPRPTHSAGS